MAIATTIAMLAALVGMDWARPTRSATPYGSEAAAEAATSTGYVTIAAGGRSFGPPTGAATRIPMT